MKKQKLLSFLFASMFIFLSAVTVMAAEGFSPEENISFLNEHKDMIDFYHSMRLGLMTEKLNSPDISEDERHQLIEDIAALRKAIENCIMGNHSYLISVDSTAGPPDCTSLGVCDYCGHSEIVLTGDGYRERHRDTDKDGICNDCKREMPYLHCDHLCHSENVTVQKVLLPFFRIIWSFLNIEEYCRCGTYHFD